MKILFIGDVYGEIGERLLVKSINILKDTYHPNVIIVNGENINFNGRGISESSYKNLMKSGVNLITMGNHTWGNYELINFIDNSNIIRPINYLNAKGEGYKVFNFNGSKVLVINALGRTFLNLSLENPFIEVEKILKIVDHDYSFLDFHAEATSEKIALAHHLDGKIDCIVGTHTHVQTADERVLPKGTIYITDVGMTGPLNGVIGVEKEIIIKRFIDGFSTHNVVASGDTQLNGVIVDLDKRTIERINLIEKE